jgi:aminopeptidase N
MENATAIFYDEKLYRARKMDDAIVAHETAHQWFGDAVTESDWHHVWLSEGFATYLSALWVGHADGDSAFRAVMNRAATGIFQAKETARPVLDSAATDLLGLLNKNSYEKGAWILHQLRGIIGDTAFFAGLRRYYERYRDSTALSSDFARIMTEVSGRDLDWYFRQALTQPGYPVLEVRWKHQKKRLSLDIAQTQPPEWGSYRIPGLQLLIDGKPFKVDVDGRETHRVIDGIAKKPKQVAVDPNGLWLVQIKSVNSER